MNKQVEKLMRTLDLTEEEALQLIADDKAIDKGEKLFELSAEQQKAAKQYTRADSRPQTNPAKKEKKADEIKVGLIELFSAVLNEQPACNSIEILNPEREFIFMWNGKKYKVVLSCPRS